MKTLAFFRENELSDKMRERCEISRKLFSRKENLAKTIICAKN